MVKKASRPLVQIPFPLIEAIKSRRTILFLGAGASKESRNAAGQRPPDAVQLRDILAMRFFGREMKNRDVMAVAEMAIEVAGGRPQVFEVVRQAFDGFPPSEAHKAVSAFNWRLIATTNYDLLIERAYAECKDRRQSLVRFVKDDEPVEEKLHAATNPLQYLKLHGCLEHLYDNEIPLILSREQYATYSDNRTRLFGRLKDLARESTLVFIGYRLDDAHIRDLIYGLTGNKRPRWYIVTPDAEEYDVAFWATKNVEVLKCRFGEFMDALDDAIPPLWRSLAPSNDVADFPVRRFYVVNKDESNKLKSAFETDISLVHAGMPIQEQAPKLFYEGYDVGWGGITRRLDVRRKVEDDLLFKVLLENENPKGPLLLMLRGAAGSGKTIALKRTAYEAATASNALVIWLEESGALKPDVFVELHELCDRSIYLFVDQVALQIEKLLPLLRAAKAKSMPLVVVGAERDSDWYTYCAALENDFTPQFLRVGNLSKGEVEGLLDLLERHDCLGLLRGKSREEQIDAFMEKERADRQLLVALHELTLGKPFEEIVYNEHQRVHPEQARQLYLDIATMHQFGVKVRAGTISRIAGIDFDDYKDQFLAPLQDIVRVEQDKYTGDYCYKTRHSRVASLVFRQVCADDYVKAKQFKRLISGLDVGYSSDLRALQEITRGRSLAENFAGISEVREIYKTAVQVAPRQGFLYQQWAIFESMHKEGLLPEAERIAAIAHEAEPRSKSIIHTQAEIDRKRANVEPSALMKESLRRRARKRLDDMPAGDRFAVSSRCKLLVDELSELKSGLNEDTKSHEAVYFAEKVKDTEAALLRAQQLHPDDADIIQVEARFRREIDQEDKALRALERAWAAGAKGPGTAIRIAKMYEARDRASDAEKVLREALARNQDDKSVHQAMAQHYVQQPNYDANLVEDHLRRSFSVEDQNFEERFNLAQFLFLRGNTQGAVDMFDVIGRKAPAGFRKVTPREENIFTSKLPRYSGAVEAVRERFMFIRSAHYPRNIFAHRSSSNPDIMDDLSIGQEVNFRIRFNREGATAVDLQLGRLPN